MKLRHGAIGFPGNASELCGPETSHTNSLHAWGRVEVRIALRGRPSTFFLLDVTHALTSLVQRTQADEGALFPMTHFSFRAWHASQSQRRYVHLAGELAGSEAILSFRSIILNRKW